MNNLTRPAEATKTNHNFYHCFIVLKDPWHFVESIFSEALFQLQLVYISSPVQYNPEFWQKDT